MPIIIGLPLISAVFAYAAYQSTGFIRVAAGAAAIVGFAVWGWYFAAIIMMELPD